MSTAMQILKLQMESIAAQLDAVEFKVDNLRIQYFRSHTISIIRLNHMKT